VAERYQNRPMTRGQAVDRIIDIALRLPGLRIDLRAAGAGFDLRIPVEQVERVSFAYEAQQGRIKELEAKCDALRDMKGEGDA
jgi:hypothetical protein